MEGFPIMTLYFLVEYRPLASGFFVSSGLQLLHFLHFGGEDCGTTNESGESSWGNVKFLGNFEEIWVNAL